MADAQLLTLGFPFVCTSAPSIASALSQNASTVSAMFAFNSLTTDPITHLGLRAGTRTGTPPTYRYSLQGRGTNGNGDGSIKVAGAAKNTFVGGTLTDGAWNWLVLDSAYTPSLGEALAAVLEYSSGTINVSNFMVLNPSVTGPTSKFPCYSTGASGVYTRQFTHPNFGYKTASGVYGSTASIISTAAINSGATAEIAMKFTVPGTWWNTYQILAARFFLGTTIVGKTMSLNLYSGGLVTDTTALVAVALDTDDFGTSGSLATFPFTSLQTLTGGNTYRVSLSTADASDQFLNYLQVASAADMGAFMGGTNFTYSSRTGGNWTDDATKRPFCELVLKDITAPSGAPLSRILTGM